MAGQSLSQKISLTSAQTKRNEGGPRNAPASSAINSNTPVRLQKYLAACGVASRRKSEELIASGRVSVNGELVREMGLKITPSRDEIAVGGKVIGEAKRGLVLFNKPDGVISSKQDPQGRKTVMDCLPSQYRSYFPVGRLDYETSGLMLLTNDGELAEYLLHPRYEVERIYEAYVEEAPSSETLQSLRTGVQLEDGKAQAMVRVLRRGKTGVWIEVRLSIGKNRIVRRLLAAVGHKVLRLVRVKHGPFSLDGLRRGQFHEFTEEAYQRARSLVLDRTKYSPDIPV